MNRVTELFQHEKSLNIIIFVICVLLGIHYLAKAIVNNMFSPFVLVIAICFCFAMILILKDPYVGLLMMVFFMPMTHFAIHGFATATKLLGWVTFGSWILCVFIRNKYKLDFRKKDIVIILYGVFLLLSLMFTANINSTKISYLFTNIQLFAMYFMVISLVDTKKKIQQILLIYILGVALSSVLGIRLYLLGLKQSGRGQGFTGDPNFFATLCLVAFSFLLSLLINKSSSIRINKVILFMIVFAIYAGIVTGMSRAGLFGFILTGILVIYKYKKKGVLLGFVIVLILLGVLFFPKTTTQYYHRMSEMRNIVGDVEEIDPSISIRIHLFLIGIRTIAAHPLLGVGTGTYRFSVYEGGRHTALLHNMYLQIGAESGMPALLVFLFICISCVIKLQRLQKHSRQNSDKSLFSFACSLYIGLLSFCFMGLALSLHYSAVLWLIIALAESLYRRSIVTPFSKKGSAVYLK